MLMWMMRQREQEEPVKVDHEVEEWNDISTDLPPTPNPQDVGTTEVAHRSDPEDEIDLENWEVVDNDTLEKLSFEDPPSRASTCMDDISEQSTPESKPSFSPSPSIGPGVAPAAESVPQSDLEHNLPPACSDVEEEAEEEEAESSSDDLINGYRCAACGNLLFHANHILSSNYQAMNGPGYLTNSCDDVVISSTLHTVQYTSGKYTIQECSCNRCSNVVGVKYTGAADASNQYKVGNFLIDRTRLVLPPGVVHPKDKAH